MITWLFSLGAQPARARNKPAAKARIAIFLNIPPSFVFIFLSIAWENEHGKPMTARVGDKPTKRKNKGGIGALQTHYFAKKPHNILDSFTNVVHNDVMANRTIDKSGSAVRASVSFAQGIYDSLEKIAVAKKVSIAWVVREAVESYLDTSANINSLPDNTVSATDATTEKSDNV
jgi:hypothetical protein